MSKAAIDRNAKDYQARKAALETKVKALAGATITEGGETYEAPLPAEIRKEMDELGVEFQGGAIVEVDPSESIYESVDDLKVGEGDPTQEEVDNVNAIDKSVSENSNPQKNKESYDKLKEAMDKFAAGGLNLDALKKLFSEVGGENNDVALQAFLVSLNAIANHALTDEQKKEALNIANNAFAFLGDDKAKHDFEAILNAAKTVLENEKIPQDLKAEIQNGIGDIDVEVDDESQQQGADDKKKKEEKEKKEKGEGVSKMNVAKKALKFGSAFGVAVGFPPFGILLAIGILCVAKGWGEDKKSKEDQDAEKLEYLEAGRKMMQAAKKGIANAKAQKLAQGASDLPDEEVEAEAEAGVKGDQALGAGGAAEAVDGQNLEQGQQTAQAIALVAADAQQEVTNSQLALGAGAVVDGAVVEGALPKVEGDAQNLSLEGLEGESVETEQGAGSYLDMAPDGDGLEEGNRGNEYLDVGAGPTAVGAGGEVVVADEVLDANVPQESGYLDVDTTDETLGNGDNSNETDAKKLAKKLVAQAQVDAAEQVQEGAEVEVGQESPSSAHDGKVGSR